MITLRMYDGILSAYTTAKYLNHVEMFVCNDTRRVAREREMVVRLGKVASQWVAAQDGARSAADRDCGGMRGLAGHVLKWWSDEVVILIKDKLCKVGL